MYTEAELTDFINLNKFSFVIPLELNALCPIQKTKDILYSELNKKMTFIYQKNYSIKIYLEKYISY